MNINPLQSQCTIFNRQIGSIKQWVWPKIDVQTFNIIYRDWVEYYDPFLREHFPRKEGTVIQAGGNCGMYPLLFNAFFKRIYTFEPDPLSFYCLVNNCQYGNVFKFNCALSHHAGYVDIVETTQADNRGMNRVKEVASPSVPAIALDNLKLDDVRLIQLDLEGFEHWALIGAKKTLKKNKPMLIVEADLNLSHVEQVLKPLGYILLQKLNRTDHVFIMKK